MTSVCTFAPSWCPNQDADCRHLVTFSNLEIRVSWTKRERWRSMFLMGSLVSGTCDLGSYDGV